jgi:transcriptional regulator with XRE-family HTH domain
MSISRSALTVPLDSAVALRALRESTGLSQAAFARAVGINQADVSMYENGHHSLTVRRLAEIAADSGMRLSLTIAPVHQPPLRPKAAFRMIR